MPVLVLVFGPLQAVPIMAIAAIMANLSRILVWWREVDWRAVGAYAATGVPFDRIAWLREGRATEQEWQGRGVHDGQRYAVRVLADGG